MYCHTTGKSKKAYGLRKVFLVFRLLATLDIISATKFLPDWESVVEASRLSFNSPDIRLSTGLGVVVATASGMSSCPRPVVVMDPEKLTIISTFRSVILASKSNRRENFWQKKVNGENK
uniref:Uncharacterized protein n=1 Tax=Romanomermis culicivorax TaxID=13658 RepID=A0A915I1Q2_ROMCU